MTGRITRNALHHLLATHIPGCIEGSLEGKMLIPERLTALVDAILATSGHAQKEKQPVAWCLVEQDGTFSFTTKSHIADAWLGAGDRVQALFASPDSSTDHDSGCQSGDFGPCDCSLSSPERK